MKDVFIWSSVLVMLWGAICYLMPKPSNREHHDTFFLGVVSGALGVLVVAIVLLILITRLSL